MTTNKDAALRAELAELEAANEAAPSWGAAVGARHERIVGIKRQLARDNAQEAPDSELGTWDEGCDFALEQVCKYLKVDPANVTWDAATETVDGDIQAVINSIMDEADKVMFALSSHVPSGQTDADEWFEVTDGTTKEGDRFAYIPNPETGVGQITSHKRRRSSVPSPGGHADKENGQ